MYDYSIFEYLAYKGLGEIPCMLILVAPTIPIIYFFYLKIKKRISEKQYINWLSLCLALQTMWLLLFLGFYWWKALLSAPLAFAVGKLQSEALLRLNKMSKNAREKVLKR